MPLTDQLRLPLGKLGKLTLGGFWSELTHEEQLLHLPNNFQIVCDKFSHSPQQFSLCLQTDTMAHPKTTVDL